MILSRTAEVALAVLPLLDPRGPDARGRGARELAALAGVPAPFLAKVLQRLVDRGLLRSKRGRSGGFVLGRPASEITLADVVLAVSGRESLEAAYPRIGGAAGAKLETARRALLDVLASTALDRLSPLDGSPASMPERSVPPR